MVGSGTHEERKISMVTGSSQSSDVKSGYQFMVIVLATGSTDIASAVSLT